MSQVMITIGRNIGNNPMSDYNWLSFKSEITSLFSELYVDAAFQGNWDNIPEISNLYIGIIDYNIMPELELRLSVIAKSYNQDAIGLIINNRKESLVYKAA